MVKDKKISFLIALQIDSQDRIDNLDISVSNLLHHYPDSEIIISEIDRESKIKDRYPSCVHIFTEDPSFFSKTRAYNIAAKSAKNDIIALYDCDVVLKKSTVEKVVNLLSEDSVDVLYPYNGYFFDVPKSYHKQIKDTYSLESVDLKDCKLLSNVSVGGCVFFKKSVFLEGGGANERIRIGYEDNEFFSRFKILGYRIGRMNCPLYHLNHVRKETSFDYNPYKEVYEKEYMRISTMNKETLKCEVEIWKNER